MDNIIYRESFGNLTLKLAYDKDPVDFSAQFHIGEILYLEDSPYIYGHRTATNQEMDEIANNPDNVALPVFAYRRSGHFLLTSSEAYPLEETWDDLRCGIIWTTKTAALIFAGTVENAIDVLKSEVKDFNHWLNGEQYSYYIEDEFGACVESGHGYTGDTGPVLADALRSVKELASKKNYA